MAIGLNVSPSLKFLLFGFVILIVVVVYAVFGQARDCITPIAHYRGFDCTVYSAWLPANGDEVAAIADSGFWVWDRDTEKAVRHTKITASQATVDSQLSLALCAGPNATLELWDLTSQTKSFVWESLDGNIEALAFLPDSNQFLAATGYNIDKDKPGMRPGTYQVKLFDLATQQLIRSFKGHVAAVTSIFVLPKKDQFISAADDHTLRLWDLKTGNELQMAGSPTVPRSTEWNGEQILRPFSDPIERPRVSSISSSGSLVIWNSTVWDIKNWQEKKQLSKLSRQDRVISSSFSPDGSRLATGHGDGTVRLWDTATWAEICRAYGHENRAVTLSLSFSKDGKQLLTGGRGVVPGFDALSSGRKPTDYAIRLWEILK